MKCIEVITDFLADYVEGRLPAEARAAFERHIADCESCTAYLQSYRDTIAMAAIAHRESRLPAQDIPEELVAAILATTRTSR
jgi:anti-sigma factor RsiW